MRYTRIPESTFQHIALNAGVIARDFDPTTGDVDEEDLIGATSGGTNFVATPTFSDFGEDIDNCPKNTKELKRIDSWDVKLSGTLVTVDTPAAQMLIGAVDVTYGEEDYELTEDIDIVSGKTYYTRSGTSPNYTYTAVANPVKASLSTYYEVSAVSPDKLTPRVDLKLSDFGDIWWVGDYSDKNSGESGGFVAIHVLNSLSTGGFQIQSGDNAKAQISYEFTGHYSAQSPKVVPFEAYIMMGA